VVYRIFTTDYNSYLSHSLEAKTEEIAQPATAAGTQQVKGVLLVKPLAGYNRTRRGSAAANTAAYTGWIF